MAHIGKERRFCPVGLLRHVERFRQRFIFRHCFTHFGIDIRKSHPDRVNEVVVPVLRAPDTGHTDHLIVFATVPLCQIPVSDDRLRLEALPDRRRINETEEAFPVAVRDHLLRIPAKPLQKRKMDPLRSLVPVI